MRRAFTRPSGFVSVTGTATCSLPQVAAVLEQLMSASITTAVNDYRTLYGALLSATSRLDVDHAVAVHGVDDPQVLINVSVTVQHR